MSAQHLLPHTRPIAGRDFPPSSVSHRSEWLKRASDLVVALAVSVVAIPLIAIAWCLVRLTSSGPAFYSQSRVGRNGRKYEIYKIRTMYHNCEAISGVQWSHKSDPRVTRVGRVLRKLHIDELPQLWNVFRGEMSLVGPRPERPEFVSPLSKSIPRYMDRLAVRPGVTGLAQIQLPPDSGIECVRKKLVLDRCYVESHSLWLDIRIMLGTFVYLAGFSYAFVAKVLWLPNPLMRAEAATASSGPVFVGPVQLATGGVAIDHGSVACEDELVASQLGNT